MSKTTYKCIDAHTCGNPVRVVTTGHPNLMGDSMSEKRQHFLKEYDWIRKGLMFEPRGHDMMSGSFFYEPQFPDNDFGILFIETSGCLPMCGHGTIGAITIAIEEGIIAEENLTVECPELGEISFDVSYGGNYYAIVDPQKNFSGVHNFTAGKLIQYSQIVRKRINEKYPNRFIHPENETIRDVSHILWTGNPIDPKSSGRNAVFYGDKAIDRSPCGTGTSARMAQLYAKGKLKKGEEFIHESYIGSTFIGRIEEETTLEGKKAIIPSIQGWAKIYGYNAITIDEEDDPYAHGFQVL